MSKVIKIEKRTGISSFSKEWSVGDEDEVVFEISRKSSFMLLAEGIALGYLQDFILRGKKISIRFPDAHKKIQSDRLHNNVEPKSLKDLVKSEADSGLGLEIPELLCGIFGLQLLFNSCELRNAVDSSEDPQEVKNLIQGIIWRTFKENKGYLGDGKSRYLIASHHYKIPEYLKKNEREFPDPEYLQEKILKIMERMTSVNKHNITNITISDLDMLSSWLYNMVENSYEHGCKNFKKNREEIKGFNGILIQKIAAKNTIEIMQRKDIDSKLKKYIQRLYDYDEIKDKHKNIIVITVMDSGNGIQNTLSGQYDSYQDIEKLNAAYKIGVTRHDYGKIKAGFGLPDSMRMVNKLKAGVAICSANIYSLKTFMELEKEMKDEGIQFKDYEKIGKSSGTSQSLIFPFNIKIAK